MKSEHEIRYIELEEAFKRLAADSGEAMLCIRSGEKIDISVYVNKRGYAESVRFTKNFVDCTIKIDDPKGSTNFTANKGGMNIG